MTVGAAWVVAVLDEQGGVVRRPFRDGRVVIGRTDDNDVVLPSAKVSRKHACLELDGGQVVVIDLGSSNGVWLNGTKLSGRQAIGPADELKIGDFRLRLEPADGAPVAVPVTASPPAQPSAPPAPRTPQALICPQCAAPLNVFPGSGPLVKCIYCGTSVRL